MQLGEAAASGDLGRVRALLAQGADRDGVVPLEHARGRGFVEMVATPARQ